MHALASTGRKAGLTAEIIETPTEIRLSLAGTLGPKNELASLARQISAKIGARSLTIVLADLRRINSVGVRDWILFLRSLEGIRDVRLERCSPQTVVQLNTVFNFRGHARVMSVIAPFICFSCDHEQEELIDVSDADRSLSDLVGGDGRRCSACGAASELDDRPSRYFMFLDAK